LAKTKRENLKNKYSLILIFPVLYAIQSLMDIDSKQTESFKITHTHTSSCVCGSRISRSPSVYRCVYVLMLECRFMELFSSVCCDDECWVSGCVQCPSAVPCHIVRNLGWECTQMQVYIISVAYTTCVGVSAVFVWVRVCGDQFGAN
jgi:hypothetical protein